MKGMTTMKATLKMKTLVAAVAVAAGFAGTAQAASGTDTTSPYSVANNVNFSIVIPGFLFFRVGALAATNTLTFTVPDTDIGNPALPVAATGGDAAASALNVEVRGNVGQITITPTVSSATGLTSVTVGNGTIDFAQIATTSSDNTNLAAPALANTGGSIVQPVINANRVTNRTAVWTYSYLNATVPGAGTYTGTATYTATAP